MPTLVDMTATYDAAVKAAEEARTAIDTADTVDDIAAAEQAFDDAVAEVERTRTVLETRSRQEAALARRPTLETVPTAAGETRVTNEPDLYRDASGGFLRDLYASQVLGDPAAGQRIARHQTFEMEKRAITTTTLGGIIPPQYLLDLVAKAPRNGRVFADQANHQTLPDTGMSLVVPRITAGLAVGVQATENTVVTTADPTEVDLTVPVRTIAGYSPVSRQTIERNAFGDQLLFEDLVARYYALLDTQCINGSGAAGQILGSLQTAGVSTSTVSTATVIALYPKIFDIIQQINTAFGGLGYVADKIIMHPRRWGAVCAAMDTQNRPLLLPDGIRLPPGTSATNPIGIGNADGYGPVGTMAGLAVYTDANIPTNLGAGTNEDRVIVQASGVVHLWERPGDPVTVSFDQTSATALTINLVAYGFAAFTAGRFPAATGVISGTGLVPPTF